MKTIIYTTVLLALIAATPAKAQNLDGTYAVAPEHPATWVAGADRIHQDLRWDNDRKVLLADVTYSTRDYADSDDPAEEDDFALPFPNVRYDATRDVFIADGKEIGTLKPGLFGPKVVLEQGVALSIHRRRGVVTAAIIRDYTDD